MPFEDFEGWRRELMFAGNILQRDDPPGDVDPDGRRYWRLVDMLDGSEVGGGAGRPGPTGRVEALWRRLRWSTG
ncbi:hypothetical protein KIH74_10780 [Kineosporia sp. J2-2]|uniref:Uncharacterized protein n=1 Tax=Kineosporia corallincola TaxID=2835133 RepID=A0ABS5TGW2_9ACTN|nr:hypothetical protein [Kineosporia corallincola]MBT0769406.1 hypothetical protein [Kineosporia corallincola]